MTVFFVTRYKWMNKVMCYPILQTSGSEGESDVLRHLKMRKRTTKINFTLYFTIFK